MYYAIIIFLVLLFLGMPVAFSIGISGLCFFLIRDLPLTVLVQKSISTSQSFTMLAIPLFILAGNLMNSCGITKRLTRFCNACTGHMWGNMGQVSCLLSTLMGGVSGSAAADAAMETRILGPEMLRLGYSRGWAAAINGLSGLIVATIPPSMGLIIFGTVGEVSIGRLFMAGWVPGILMCVLLMLFLVALPNGSYRLQDGTLNTGRMLRDLAAHATFTHNLFAFSYTGSPLNGALWTLGVEMQFYLLFPFIARLFRRWPAFTWLLMTAAAFIYRGWVKTLPDTTLYFNQLPAMLDVYANGMAAAAIYSALKRRMKQDKWTAALFTVILCIAVCGLRLLVKTQASITGYENIRMGQMTHRFPLSVLTALSLLGVLYGIRPLRLLLGNRATAVLAAISYQFYMYHQPLAVQLKAWGIPASVNPSPWMSGERSWQILYTVLCFAGALAISALITYAFERPIVRLGRGKKPRRRKA